MPNKKQFYKSEQVKKPHLGFPTKWVVIFILAIAFFVGIFFLTRTIATRWEVISFAFSHSEMVMELKNLYDHEHSEADENVLFRQRLELKEVNSEELVATESGKK